MHGGVEVGVSGLGGATTTVLVGPGWGAGTYTVLTAGSGEGAGATAAVVGLSGVGVAVGVGVGVGVADGVGVAGTGAGVATGGGVFWSKTPDANAPPTAAISANTTSNTTHGSRLGRFGAAAGPWAGVGPVVEAPGVPAGACQAGGPGVVGRGGAVGVPGWAGITCVGGSNAPITSVG